jgi:hypothetical protein
MNGMTRCLADYAVVVRYEDLPPVVIQRAKDCITDTVGAIICGADLPWSKMIIAYARANVATVSFLTQVESPCARRRQRLPMVLSLTRSSLTISPSPAAGSIPVRLWFQRHSQSRKSIA